MKSDREAGWEKRGGMGLMASGKELSKRTAAAGVWLELATGAGVGQACWLGLGWLVRAGAATGAGLGRAAGLG